jgi:hypothetical protein
MLSISSQAGVVAFSFRQAVEKKTAETKIETRAVL